MPASDIASAVTGSASWVDEMRLKATDGLARVVMRRGVKEFNFFYDDTRNALITSQRCFAELGSLMAPSLRDVTPIQCVFGSRSLPYIYGNLQLHNCWEDCIDLAESSFRLIGMRKLAAFMQAVTFKGVSTGIEMLYDAEGVTFNSVEELQASRKRFPIMIHIPQALTLRAERPSAIVSLGPRQTFVAQDLVEALQRLDRPKSKILGMTFAPPTVTVRFLTV